MGGYRMGQEMFECQRAPRARWRKCATANASSITTGTEARGITVTTPAAIGAALGMPAAEATSLLTRHQWREGDVALLQAAAARLGVRCRVHDRPDPDAIGPDGTVRLRCYLPSANSLWFSAGCQGRRAAAIPRRSASGRRSGSWGRRGDGRAARAALAVQPVRQPPDGPRSAA